MTKPRPDASPHAAIDAHAHIGGQYRASIGADYLDVYMAEAEHHGVERVLVSSLGRTGYTEFPTPEQLTDANDEVAEALGTHPRLAGFVYCSGEHPRASVEQMRRHIAEGPFVGVKLWIARHADSPDCDDIFAYAAELGVPVLQHASRKVRGQLSHESTPAHVARAARRHPGTTIQMAHATMCGLDGVREVADCPNVVVDLCGMDAFTGLAESVVSIMGADRVLWASDGPARAIGIQLAKVTGSTLDEATRRKVLRDNALRLYPRLVG